MDDTNISKPKIRRFEDLYCWQISRELTNEIYRLTNRPDFRDFSLANQIQRAIVSVMSNIAEGFERGTIEEQIHFYYIAKASCGEVRSQLYIIFDQGKISQAELDELSGLAKRVSAAIYNFTESLKVSKFKGLKYKRNATKEEAEGAKKMEDYYLESGFKKLPDGTFVTPEVYNKIIGKKS